MLRNAQFISTLEHMVFQNGVPLLGVCVGMQMLSDYSEEGKEKGLGWIPGEVLNMNNVRCPSSIRLPHMGWNNVNITKSTPLLTSIDQKIINFTFFTLFTLNQKIKDTFSQPQNMGLSLHQLYQTQISMACNVTRKKVTTGVKTSFKIFQDYSYASRAHHPMSASPK